MAPLTKFAHNTLRLSGQPVTAAVSPCSATAARELSTLHGKVKALELLGKHLGMFVDRKELIVTPGADRPSREWLLEDIIRVRDQLQARAVEGEYSEAFWAHLPPTVRNRILTRFWSAQGR